jgi:hypothetical protein
MVRIRSRTSLPTAGRPTFLFGLQDSSAQYLRKRFRCQRTTVSGCTKIKACRQPFQTLANAIQNTRSERFNRGRLLCRL